MSLFVMCSICETDVDTCQANVLIDGTGRACITNFGLSEIKYDTLSQCTTSKVHSPAGIMHFMAPETMKGNITMKGDVYSFGMLIDQVSLGRFIDGV
jgi:serine/threonine protein kinase